VPGAVPEVVAPARAPSAAGETVLVVEDEPSIRSLACEMLEGQGYRTLSAGSGEEALGLAVRHAGPIHVLLADVVMPGLAGPALAERFAVVRARRWTGSRQAAPALATSSGPQPPRDFC
jgi:CheY-like chemotaxis protein